MLISGCSSDSPTEAAAPFEPGTWAGSFTFNANYGSAGTVSQSGDVIFNFSRSDYTYEGTVTSLTNRTRFIVWGPGTFLRDRGSLTKNDRTALLVDFATESASEVRLRSLYFHGNYSYSVYGASMSFSRSENGESMTVTLTKQE